VEFPGPDQSHVVITTPGVYYFTVEITDDQSNVYTDTVAIEVLDLAQFDVLLKGKWAGMKDSLMNGDIENALDFFHDSVRQDYQEIFDILIDQLPVIASELGEIELNYVQDIVAKYRIEREEEIQGQVYNISYNIRFIKGPDGLWRIESF
jgi:hypothetical protein